MQQLSMNVDPTKAKPEDEESFGKEPVIEEESGEEEVVSDPEPQVYTISELNQAIRSLLEGEFPLMWVRGEISNFKAHSSGHWYFSLKDDKAQVNAVMFRGFNSRLRFRPESGMEVMVRGRVTVYEPRGNYQVFCELMDPVGAGALQKAYEQLKAKLEKEGLFDPARKKALPAYPQHVAIVTSPTGAAIRDMLNVLGRRFKCLNITVIPAVVQGDQAPASIVHGIQMANQLKDVDVLIVGRGGGSIEDLWGFNDESVARAIANSRLPVISGVGHEVDFTIADFVADLRAPTPSAAAELVVKSTEDLQEKIALYSRRLTRSIVQQIEYQKQQVSNLKRHLIDPRRRLQDLIQRSDEVFQRLEQAAFHLIEKRRMQVELLHRRMINPKDLLQRLQLRQKQMEEKLKATFQYKLKDLRSRLKSQASMLDSLSPLRVVDRGFSIVKSEKKLIKSIDQVKAKDPLSIRVKDGEILARVEEVKNLK